MTTKVPPFYIDHIADTLRSMGVSEEEWLESCGVGKGLSESSNLWLPVEQYIELISRAVELSVFPDIGLRVGQRLGIGSHGMLGFALLNCRDLEQAINILSRYIATRTPLLKTEIKQSQGRVSILLSPAFELPGARRAFIETVTVTFCNLFIMLTPEPFKKQVLEVICFDFEAPLYAESYHDYFPVKCDFKSQDCRIVLNSTTLHRHFNQSDEVALNNLINQFEQQLATLPGSGSGSVKDKVQNVLDAEHHRIPNLEEVAKVLFITPRTLHRRLKQENTSYRELLASTKKKQAIQYLEHSQLTIQQIAWSLGYDDVANFRRAFKTWTGVTPGHYRDNISNLTQ